MSYAYADKKWSEMTDEEKAAAGSKSDHKAAKEGASSEPAEKTYTAEVTGASLNNLKLKQEKEAREKAKVEAKEKASAYLANHSNAGKGGTKDAGFQKILKEGGLSNHEFNNMGQAENKAKYEQAQDEREKETRLKQQYHTDRQNATTQDFGQIHDYSAYLQRRHDQYGQYFADNKKNETAERLMSTGLKFGSGDFNRELGYSSTHSNIKALYHKYGGKENYDANHSFGSGNWRPHYEQEEYLSDQEANANRETAYNERYDFYNNDKMKNKYSEYDWFNKGANNYKEYNNPYSS